MADVWYSSLLGGFSSFQEFQVHKSVIFRICCICLRVRMFSMYGSLGFGVDCLKFCPLCRFDWRCCGHLRRQPHRLFPKCARTNFRSFHRDATCKPQKKLGAGRLGCMSIVWKCMLGLCVCVSIYTYTDTYMETST